MPTKQQIMSGTSHTIEDDGSGAVSKTAEELATIVSQFSASGGWMDRVRLRVEGRWYERLYHGLDHDIWVISWLPGQSTGFHDHGASSGAFVVATGLLEEHQPGEPAFVIFPNKPRSFDPNYAHDVRNASLAPAISIHAYSPPLSEMNEYELDGGQLVPREVASKRVETLAKERRLPSPNAEGCAPSVNDALNIDHVLSATRERLRRLSPIEAFDAMAQTEAILVDIHQNASEQSRAVSQTP